MFEPTRQLARAVTGILLATNIEVLALYWGGKLNYTFGKHMGVFLVFSRIRENRIRGAGKPITEHIFAECCMV